MSAFLLFVSALAAQEATPEKIRTAAAKGLERIQASQRATKQGCVSCHTDLMPIVAMGAARRAGIAFDTAYERAHAAKIFRYLGDLDRAVTYAFAIDEALNDGTNLLAAHAAGVRPNLAIAVYARHIALRQDKEGFWRTQDGRPPQSYSKVQATGIALRTLQLFAHPTMAADTQARMKSARAWLERQKPRDASETAQQLTAMGWAGTEDAVRKRVANKLLSMQRADGGWATTNGRESDAYGTGEALVALADHGGVLVTDEPYRKGVAFLLRTQKADGSWFASSRLHPPASVSPPYYDGGYPGGHDQFVSMMGASQAVMALARALGVNGEAAGPALGIEADGAQPWMETALFGTAAELESLLEAKKVSVSAATAGGTSLLMFSAANFEKVKLLLARGANLNVQSKKGFTPLLVASGLPGNVAVVEHLLQKGAKLTPPRKPQHEATPLMMATFSHDVAMVKALLAAGAPAGEPMWVLGTFPGVPAGTAVYFDDVAVLRALLDHGVDVDSPDEEGTTLLAWAAVAGKLEAAKLLLARGAKVNVVDKKGMTPLLYAASVDFGDGEMARVLRKAGASTAAKTTEGATAIDLARRYRHVNVAAALTDATGR